VWRNVTHRQKAAFAVHCTTFITLGFYAVVGLLSLTLHSWTRSMQCMCSYEDSKVVYLEMFACKLVWV